MTSIRDIGSKIRIIKYSNSSNESFTDNKLYCKGCLNVGYFPSVNSMYIIARGRKILNPDCRDLRNELMEQLNSSANPNAIKDSDTLLDIKLGYYLKYSIYKRDLDNMEKFIIDTLANFYGFNDNRVFDIRTYKREILDSDTELLYYKISRDDIDPRNMSISMKELL